MLLLIDVVDNTVDTDDAVDAASIVRSFQWLIVSSLTMLLSIDDGVDAASSYCSIVSIDSIVAGRCCYRLMLVLACYFYC
jgi:hypothetical protein